MAMEPDPLLALEARLRTSEEAALAALWELHRERLLRLVRFRMDARLARRVDAEDVLQESFMAARQRLAHFAADGFRSSFVWLRLIVVQTMIDCHRRHLGADRRDAHREQALDAPARGDHGASAVLLARLSTGGLTPSALMVSTERGELLRRALDRLSDSDRTVLAMRHGEHLGNHEVAEALGLEEKAASIRYVRAIRRLKEALAAGGGMTSEVDRVR